MVFSSSIFLFAFLPVVLLVYVSCPTRLKNIVLFAASLFFYAWGELFYSVLMLVSITCNYMVGRLIERSDRHRKLVLATGVFLNLFLLGFFKYANFISDAIGSAASPFVSLTLDVPDIHLPLGISFFTFQAISYIVDVYRRATPVQKNFLNLGLYISLFPQLIAGPIVRYNTIAGQLVTRKVSLDRLEAGVARFICGLAKKMLIANPLGAVADSLFSLPPDMIPVNIAVLAIACYSLQIFFDFSGYSDMAIGLGRMFGFTFPENFNYPYIARSVREFWRRWHISLTTWFRDYMYIPMGGNRGTPWRVAFNLLSVFVLCGLWHGASWNYLVWGLWHGLFLVLERGVFGAWIGKFPAAGRHLYTLLVVMLGWVFFRIEDMGAAWSFLGSLLGRNGIASNLYPVQLYLSSEAVIAFGAGVLLSMPLVSRLDSLLRPDHGARGPIRVVTLSLLLFLSMLKISSGTYNPFIYFRF